MYSVSNSFNALIGKSVSRTASVQITDPSTSSTYIASGELVVLDANDNVLTPGMTITDSPSIRIVQGDGSTNPLVFSNRIVGANVSQFGGQNFVGAQEQIYYVGFNGASGSIDLLNNNVYNIRVIFKHDVENWSEQRNILYQEYTSDSTATQSEIAYGFAAKYAQTYPASNADIRVERIADGTFTVLGGSSTLAVANGSNLATASSASHGLVAGSIVRIGSPSANSPAYLVTAAIGTAITLDTVYVGTSATVANANVGVISANTVFGLKFSGKAIPFTAATVGRFAYQKVAFDLTVGNSGATGITAAQEANVGNGTFEQVASMEYFSLGFDGWLQNRNAVPYTPQPRTNAVSTSTYDTIVIKASDNSDFGVVSGNKPSPFSVYMFIPSGSTQITNLLAQLNPWMASLPRAFANVAIV